MVALDPFRSYANDLLAHAEVVLDHFHTIAWPTPPGMGCAAGCNNGCSATGGARGDRLYGIRRLLLVGAERLVERGRAHIAARPAAGDASTVGAAWTATNSCGPCTPPTTCSLPAWRWCVLPVVDRGAGPRGEPVGQSNCRWGPRCSPYHTTGCRTEPPRR